MQDYCTFLSNILNEFLKFGSSLTAWTTIFPISPRIPLNMIAIRFNKAQKAGYVEESDNYDIAQILKEIETYTYQKIQ